MPSQRKDETREEYSERMAAYMRERYAKTALWLREYKLEKGCADCGWKEHHAGLEFDHINERFGDSNSLIMRMAGRGVARVRREVEENCEVVCSRCHSIRTWERNEARKLAAP